MNKVITAFTFLLQNVLLGFILIKYINQNSSFQTNNKINNFLSWLGQESLGIYLWHVLPILIAKHYFAGLTQRYYLFTFILLILLLFIVSIMNKSKFLKQYFLGKL